MMVPGASQYQGKLKERADVLFAWMELHQFTFHHQENWCSRDTDDSWIENISTARWKDILETPSRKIVPLKWYTRKLLFEMVKNIQVVFGKGTVKGKKRKKLQL
jgi:hypothetical protein